MNFENTVIWGFEHALRGMRNPMNSWNKSDSKHVVKVTSYWCNKSTDNKTSDMKDNALIEDYIIGESDMKLAQRLIKGGSEHRKFLRQIFVSVDITAPLYWWKEFDTYKIGITANSTSTMHKLCSAPITLDCFEIDDMRTIELENQGVSINDIADMINFLEDLRQQYLKTKNKVYWKELVRWLPESYLQTRTVTMSYENIRNMISQRKNHKLNEWSGVDESYLPNFISWAKALLYAKELLFYEN